MDEAYKRKLVDAFEAVDSLILNDPEDKLYLEEDEALGDGVAHLHSELRRVLESEAS